MSVQKKILQNEEDLEYKNKTTLYPIEIKIGKEAYSIFEIKRKHDNKKNTTIILDSEFQRRSVWNLKQKIELVESVLMGLPLPLFYFNQDENGKLFVVDGKQRLTALFEFMNDEYVLKDLKILPRFNAKKFSELEELHKTQIEDYQITVHIIKYPTPPNVQYDIFDRVNRAGTRLNTQEIRHALHQGKATELLEKIRNWKVFAFTTENSFKYDNRMKDDYTILRFIAFHLYFNSLLTKKEGKITVPYIYKNDIDDLLSVTMQYINSLDSTEVIENIVQTAFENVEYYFEENAFRLTELNPDGNVKRYPINNNIFETVMYGMTLLPYKSVKHQQSISSKITEMKLSDKFRKTIISHRDALTNIEERKNMILDIVNEVNKL